MPTLPTAFLVAALVRHVLECGFEPDVTLGLLSLVRLFVTDLMTTLRHVSSPMGVTQV